MALKSWEPTTDITVGVTNVATLILPANSDAAFRRIETVEFDAIWLGLGAPAVAREGVPVLLGHPWHELEQANNDMMFRGDIYAVHNFGDGVVIEVHVLEGEGVVMPPPPP